MLYKHKVSKAVVTVHKYTAVDALAEFIKASGSSLSIHYKFHPYYEVWLDDGESEEVKLYPGHWLFLDIHEVPSWISEEALTLTYDPLTLEDVGCKVEDFLNEKRLAAGYEVITTAQSVVIRPK